MMPRCIVVSFLLTGVLPLIAGCAEASSDTTTIVRDSAGVRIVESQRPVWEEEGEAWRVASAPRMAVGVQEGAPEYQFFRLRDAARLMDGTVVASNAGSGELRFYDSNGRFLRAVGGHGGGPGEFHEFSSLRICAVPDGDLLVEDGGQDRINVFARDGEFLRTVRLAAAEGRPPGILGCFGKGDLLGVYYAGGGTLQGDPGDVIRNKMSYTVVGPGGTIESTVAEVDTRQRFVNKVDDIIHYPFIPFSPEPLIAAGHDIAYLSTDGSTSVRLLDEEGTLQAVYRWRSSGREAVEAIWSRYVTASLEEIARDDRRRRYARFYAQDLPLPDSVPALQSLLVDGAGNLWAEEYRLPWESGSRWSVLSSEGEWLGTVALPDGFRPLDIGGDYLLGRSVDELGVERLLMFDLVRHSVRATRKP